LPGQGLVDEADMGPFMVVGTKDAIQEGREKAAGFDGTVRVLGSLLMDDVWPCLWWRHVGVQQMWSLARLHPSGVYVGPVVQSQVEGWEKLKGVQGELWKKADDWRRGGRLP